MFTTAFSHCRLQSFRKFFFVKNWIGIQKPEKYKLPQLVSLIGAKYTGWASLEEEGSRWAQ